MPNLYFLSGFNNYYNRQIKLPKAKKVADFDQKLIVKIEDVDSFKPNDTVMTRIEVNYWEEPELPDATTLDYLLVSENGVDINSRWFILDRVRNRGQQWEMTLRRDLVADNYDAVINAPCFIEKATLNADNKLIYNSEDFATNQIKQAETLLTDKSGCPWIVGYLAEKNSDKNKVEELEATFDYDAFADITVASLDDWEYETNRSYIALMHIYSLMGFRTNNGGRFQVAKDGTTYFKSDAAFVKSSLTRPGAVFEGLDIVKQKLIDAGWTTTYYPAIEEAIPSLFPGSVFLSNRFDIQGLKNKILYDRDGQKFYRISVASQLKSEELEVKSGEIYNKLAEVIAKSGVLTGTPNSYSFKEDVRYFEYTITLTEVSSASGSVNLPTNRYKTSDGTYDMFCMPYADIAIHANGVEKYIQQKDISLAAATGLARQYYGGGVVYDLQLVPFCPAPYILDDDGNIDIKNYVVGTIKSGSGESATEVGVVIFPTETQLTFEIPFSVPLETDAIEKKIKNQCEFYRLCSPNYNGIFEFNAQKNGGVNNFNVDITYKPYQPYIHINPDFGELYGTDFDDARGLICGGDFSLPINTDAWATYELQNKNYQKQFDRQIENMELNNRLARAQEITGIVTGTLAGGISGAGSGALVGAQFGGAGAIPGAVIGATAGVATGLVGGIADYQINEMLRAESLDYTRDMYGYNLANIQALPYSLAKTTAYTNNNKIFPFVERYDATEEEKEALRNKLTYNGMSVGVIGKIADYLQVNPSYIKGSIIRIENSTTLDFHSLTELSNEIYKGVFI